MFPFIDIDKLRRRTEEQMERMCTIRGQYKEKMADKAEQWKNFKEQRSMEWNNFWNSDRIYIYKFGTGLTSKMMADGTQSETNANEIILSEGIQNAKSEWSWPFRRRSSS